MKAFTILVTVLVSSVAFAAVDSTELYRRIVPLEATTGVVSIGSAVSVRLDLPEECDDGTWECDSSQRFSRVFRIDFEIEERFMTSGTPLVDRRSRGAIYLALSAERDDEDDYVELLRESLAGLGAATFDSSLAGLTSMKAPFGGEVAKRSDGTSWACFDADGGWTAARYTRTTRTTDDGTQTVTGSHTGTYGSDELVEPVCTALAQATQAYSLDEIRTMSTPRLLLESSVTVDVADALPARVYGDQLVALPDGASLGRAKREGVTGSTSLHRANDAIRAARTIDEVETRAAFSRAELPISAVSGAAWHARWRFETAERRMGPRPEARLADGWAMTASLMPTVPPEDLDSEDEPAALDPDATYSSAFDEESWFERVAEALDEIAEITPSSLADQLVEQIDGLGDGGWILVVCMPDGSATWGLPPTTGRAVLVNAREFCSSVEASLP